MGDLLNYWGGLKNAADQSRLIQQNPTVPAQDNAHQPYFWPLFFAQI